MDKRQSPALEPFCSENQPDDDNDGVGNECDNCRSHYNPNQEDTDPPVSNGCGNACECEGNFDNDSDVDGTDVSTFKNDFGRSSVMNPCTIVNDKTK